MIKPVGTFNKTFKGGSFAYGGLPHAISIAVIPNDQISAFELYLSSLTTSKYILSARISEKKNGCIAYLEPSNMEYQG